MVKIALAGGSSSVGREVLDALVATNKHQILLLSRQASPSEEIPSGVEWIQVSYVNVGQLSDALRGVDVVLSFLGPSNQDNNASNLVQRNLIDACIKAGVKRFAPSEWGSSHFEHMSWYSYKGNAREYLAEVNKDKKVLEYSFFQPGLFVNYFTYPFQSAKHLPIFEIFIDFHNRRALISEGGENDIMTFTTVQDLAKVVALAVDDEREWPIYSGVKGADITVGEMIAIGEKIRGPFKVEKLSKEDLKAGVAKPSWSPSFAHPGIPPETREAFAGLLLGGMLLGIAAGTMRAANSEWNERLPDFKFTQPEEFLTDAWAKIDSGAKSV